MTIRTIILLIPTITIPLIRTVQNTGQTLTSVIIEILKLVTELSLT